MTRGVLAVVLLLAAAVATMLATASPLVRPASAQEEALSQQRTRIEPTALPKDYLQRSQEIYEFRKAAESGPERGQEIFYYKCWFCHNEYTKDIPKLTGLYQHANLISGEPVV